MEANYVADAVSFAVESRGAGWSARTFAQIADDFI